MRKILYKAPNSDNFETYIDIGYCDRDYYYICMYLEGPHETLSGKHYYENYDAWFKDFQTKDIGSQLITLNFYFREYTNKEKELFGESYGLKTAEVITENLEELSKFNEDWFEENCSLFKGLDLGWEYDEEDELIASKTENEEEIATNIYFHDGSEIKFLDENDKIASFYVPEKEFETLKNKLTQIVEIFR